MAISHTRLVRRKQALAKGVIWGAAIATITILVLIVGYIIVNGFVTRKVVDYPVTSFAEEQFDLFDGGKTTAVLVASRSLRLDDLTYEALNRLYRGRESFWGFMTGQNRTTAVFVGGDTEFQFAFERYSTGERGFGDEISPLSSPEAVTSQLSSDGGSLAAVPVDWVSDLDKVRVVPLRRTSVVVHPEVLALQEGRRLSYISASDLEGLLSGRISFWSEIGGPVREISAGRYEPLPVVPVVLDQPHTGTGHLTEILGTGGDVGTPTIHTRSLDEYIEALETTPGAIGLLDRKYTLERGIEVLPVERITVGLNLRPSFILEPPSRAGAVGGISYIILNTLAMVLFVLIIATPIGLSAAIFLVEYAKQGRLLTILRIGTDTLAGIPSIIFGLFGMVFFSQFLGLKTGLVSGTLTLTLMILPTIVRTSEEALKSVPDILREGSLALGATKLQTIIRLVLPAASPGILTGVILGIGRAVGETAALLFTMGSNLALLRSLNSPIRVLSVHLYMLIRENISLPNAFAAATILIVIVFFVNYTTTRLIGRLNRMAGR